MPDSTAFRSRSLLVALVVAAIVTGAAPLSFAEAPPRGVVMAGAAEFDITPRIKSFVDRNGNGVHDMGDPAKPFDLGEPVLEFEDGPIYVGNGSGLATHVHGPLMASALVVEDPETGTRVALVSTDLYMVLQADTDAIRKLVGATADIDFILLGSTHTHMGPDTIGLMGLSDVKPMDFPKILWGEMEAKSGVNHVWFEWMMRQTARAIEQAAFTMAPAKVRVSKTKFSFGMADEREPHIIDDDLMTLALDGLDGRPIATVVQGTCHPESILLNGDPRYTLLDPASVPEETQKAWGHIITPGFPGWVRQTIRDRRGGTPLYFSGALGGMITNITSKIWDPEAHPEFPADADPTKVPDAIKIAPDMRFEVIQGRAMAKAALASLESAHSPIAVDVSFDRESILVPLENPLFRLTGGLGIMGHSPSMLYDDEGKPDPRTKRGLKGMVFTGVEIPKGANVKTEVSVVNIGPAQFLAMPGELFGELSVGLPNDFPTNEDRYFPHDKSRHAHGEALRLKFPPLKQQATRPYPFIVCLAGNDLGYIIPEVDFKPPHEIPVPPLVFWWISLDASASAHYEESMTASSKLEERIIGGLTRLLDRQRVAH